MAQAVAPEKSTNVRAMPPWLGLVRGTFRGLAAVAPGAGAAVAELLFRRARPYPRPPREEAWLAAAEPFTVSAGGRRIAAWSWGDGPPVLLVHGWEGRASQMGGLALGLAEVGFRAVSFDAPGHGRSAGRLSSLPEFAAAIAAVAGRVGPLDGLVGHSFGAVASAYALLQGLAARRLVFIATAPDVGVYLNSFGRLLGISPTILALMVRRIERRFGMRWEDGRFATVRAARPVPLLVVHDRDDEETPFAGGEVIARAWAGSQLFATSGLGHRRILRDPAVAREVVNFLTGASALRQLAAGRATAAG
jgi:pimeloyl-ACP methyl ester carboxylesterase